MENKYYTPEIDEFHVGFEYEAQEIVESGTSMYWEKYVFEINDSLELLFKPNDWYDLPRVKYLDKEDIESLGFKFISNTEYTTHLAGDGYVLNIYLDNKILISYGTIHESDIMFDGVIKNKSELKKLLKQLNIE